MKKLITFTIILLLNTLAHANSDIEEAVKDSFERNMQYTRDEDFDKTLTTIHTQSLSYLSTKNMLGNFYGTYKLNYEVVDYKFLSFDGEIAYIRVKQRTTKVSGPAFQNNEMDMLQAYKQEHGVWKLWAQANMSVKYIN